MAAENQAVGNMPAGGALDDDGASERGKRQRTAEAATASRQQRASPEAVGCPDFVPSEAFKGGREGFVFKAGDRGLGYYADGPGRPVERGEEGGRDPCGPPGKPQGSAHGMVLKANKPLVKVRARHVDVAGRRGKKPRKEVEKPAVKSLYDRELERYDAMSCSDSRQSSRPLVK
eukprot:evm.model.scf_1651.1 EVM.evm.TU.scf_1651.1   scf_1651:3498-4529(-)